MHKNSFRASLWTTVVAALVCVAVAAPAQQAGTVASVAGQADIGRGGEFTPAAPGMEVVKNDEIRTGRPGRIRIVFNDDSVITLGDDSQITIDEQIMGDGTAESETLLGLLQGKINSVVSEHYRKNGGRFEVRTRTATAGVRGTEFIVTYDPDTELTEVVGVSGTVSVHGAFDLESSAVLITAQELTSVSDEGLPTAPTKLDDETFREYLNDIEFINTSLNTGHPLAAGSGVPQPDRAPAGGGASVEGNPELGLGLGPDASSVLGQSPAAVKSSTGTLGIDIGNP